MSVQWRGAFVLCFNFDCNPGSEFHGKPTLEYGDFGDQSFNQKLVKLCDDGRLTFDEVLQAVDLLQLIILACAIHLGLLAHVPET